MNHSTASAFLALALFGQLFAHTWAQQCGSQAGGALCANNLCCSQYGFCGTTDDYCGTGCQSGCPTESGGSPPSTPSGSVSDIVSSGVFDQFYSQRSAAGCPSNGFYTYEAFTAAAASQNGFGTTGDSTVANRELAAFFANTAHETGSGCYVEEIQKDTYCNVTVQWPCAPGKQYYGRGPIQLTWNYNYGPAGQALGFDGINDPEIVAEDATISFKTAVWYWMTQGSPTCHTAIVSGQGFGATIKTINGGLECGSGANTQQQQSRISLYQNFCSVLGVDPGDNLTC